LPEVEPGVRVVLGEAYGKRSPVKISGEMLYVAATLKAGARLKLPDARERAVYIAQGSLRGAVDGQLLVFAPGEVVIEADTDARVMIIGGEPSDGRRHMWWNFVHSSHERIEQARADWRAQRFGQIPGEHEFIPLPARHP
jgi:redox-sensitive bicupin YhaK (pirin superfamily)